MKKFWRGVITLLLLALPLSTILYVAPIARAANDCNSIADANARRLCQQDNAAGSQAGSNGSLAPGTTQESCAGTQIAIKVGCQGSDNPIFAYLRGIIIFLAGLVGLFLVLSIIIGGIQYMTSAGSPDAIKKAKGRIVNAVVGLIFFIFLAAIVRFLVPGSI